MKKTLLAFVVITFMATSAIAEAHVVVRPSEVTVGVFQTFTMGVPVEKDMATVGLRLIIPDGLDYVTPNVKTGWKVTANKELVDGVEKVTEITWTGGSIPAGQRDDFLFSAKVPATETLVAWKAYQTYSDGSVVAWDMTPPEAAHGHSDSVPNPYSQTKIVAPMDMDHGMKSHRDGSTLPTIVSTVALAISIITLSKVRKTT